MQYLDHSEVATLVRTALSAGGRMIGRTICEWDVSNGCSSPVLMEMVGRPAAKDGQKYVDIRTGTKTTLRLDMWVSCRRCPACLRRRRRLWTMRSAAEITQAARTWFVTLTLQPSRLYLCETVAKQRDIGYDERTQDEQDRARFAVIAEELQKFLKRIRKNSGAKLRYLCVQELHKSGQPHYHLLIHEVSGTLTKSVLQAAWAWGFSQAKLADPRTAIYVYKYLTKTEGARVRASLGYGRRNTVSSQSGDQPREVTSS